jgi:ABC-type uncharacterized transport system fused permease/ATPase subunit
VLILLSSRVVPHVFSQEKAEGYFRYAHARIRAFVESIAFYNGEEDEQRNISSTFKSALARNITVIRKSFALNCKSSIEMSFDSY